MAQQERKVGRLGDGTDEVIGAPGPIRNQKSIPLPPVKELPHSKKHQDQKPPKDQHPFAERPQNRKR
ncbi:MAG TPA: hypothetical protein VKP30_33855 [Polyangiaceae bacterium]|nr:hypothetical protein [Polyangiaceae bacterium]